MFCNYCGQKLDDESIFCSRCGKKLPKEFEPDTSVTGTDLKKHSQSGEQPPVPVNDSAGAGTLQTQGSESDIVPQAGELSNTLYGTGPMAEQLSKMSQIIGPNADYYIAIFDEIKNGEPDKVNPAAAFSTGLCHACYRNVFHEWLREMKAPFFITQAFACVLLVCFAVNLMAAVCLMPVVAGMGIWYQIAHKRYVRRFNRIYMEHVKQKIEWNDIRPDPSWKRAMLSVLCIFIYFATVFVLFFTAVGAGYYDHLFNDEYDYHDSGASYDYHEDNYAEAENEDNNSDELSVPSYIEEPKVEKAPDDISERYVAVDSSALDYIIGSWIIDGYTSEDYAYRISFNIYNENGEYYLNLAAMMNEYLYMDNVPMRVIYRDEESIQAAGSYMDSMGNTGEITLEFPPHNTDYLDISIGVDNYDDMYYLEMLNEPCSRENLIRTAHGGPIRVLNTFLSSFSEAYFPYGDVYVSGNVAQMIDFAFIHNIIHNQAALQYADLSMSFPADTIAQTVREYFNTSITHQSTSQYTYRDNRYYTTAASGEYYGYCSIADELYQKSDSTWDTHFVVFSTPEMSITDLMDERGIFSLQNALDDSDLEPLYNGTATLGRKEEGGYYLISYEINDSF